MSRLGMDADAVEAAGRELGGLATQVQRTVQDIDRLVTSLPAVWLGPSVTRYVHQWEGGMRWQTLGAADSVARLGKTALANAAAQRQVSGTLDGGGSGGGPGEVTWPGALAGVMGLVAIGKNVLKAPTFLGQGMKAAQWVKNYNRMLAQGKFANGMTLKLAKDIFKIDGRNVLGNAGKLLADPTKWDDVPKAMSRLSADSKIANMFSWMPEGSGGARIFSGIGKALGPLGVAVGAYDTWSAASEGNYAQAGYSGVMTALTAAALVPGPHSVICGGIAAGMAVGQLIYDNREAIGEFASNAWGAVSDTASTIKENLNPMNWFD